MNPKTKIKVKVEDLLAAVRAKQEQAETAHEEALVEYELALAAYVIEAVAYLSRQVEQVQNTTAEEIRRAKEKGAEKTSKLADVVAKLQTNPSTSLSWELGHSYDKDRPDSPSKPYKESYATAIRQLEMAADPTILISAEDFASYLR